MDTKYNIYFSLQYGANFLDKNIKKIKKLIGNWAQILERKRVVGIGSAGVVHNNLKRYAFKHDRCSVKPLIPDTPQWRTFFVGTGMFSPHFNKKTFE